MSGTSIRIVAFIVTAVYFVATWMTTGSPETALLRYLSTAIFVVSVCVGVWEKWLWRLPVFQQLPNVPRNVRGTWQAELKSLWVDPKTKKGIGGKTVFLVIRQTSATMSIVLLSDESQSRTSLARIKRGDARWFVHYIYINEPNLDVSDHSPMHHGSGVLEVVGQPAQRLTGKYWTDRDSKGVLLLSARSEKFADDYADAKALF